MSIAQRVSNEMGESRLGAMVGYQIRMESKFSDETALLFCTTVSSFLNDTHLHRLIFFV